ncbi:SDR family NAD(P)-dependent oxidoreductase [Alteraurantiacibacter aquimixticola]|uniref:SDR family NAD(P)-dependent oxidoreductase n=1 Tax=Alteraurantiacibacter aquimixticola TaxID=2489173 RepID=A0A4T3EZL2_9SPHN|nr:SDR family NAD(P)-dependent oxidoreductase [Alteraurantiacibacter aquimixticola]TIX49584.1 SDR family NAD(P)-dependent oxidoreductase [Alteraurantiacibacter aquimixticola]
MDPSGKLAVVTGGNSGLGEATAVALLARGCRVVTLDLGGTPPDGAECVACDVSDPAQVKGAVERISSTQGAIHILVNSAGIGGIGPIASAEGPGDVAAIRKVIDVNLMGAINVTAEVAHRMTSNDPTGEDEERGVIINACSIASFEGQEGMSAYTAAKAGLAGLTLVWTRDMSQYHVRCAGIAPGFMATPMVSFLPEDFVAELLKDAEFPKRAGRADEFAKTALFIIENPLINGEVIRLDAGTRPPARTQWSAG